MNHFLFVCSVNMLRSPTAEHVARRMGYIADSAGTDDVAVRPLTKEAIDRAERIVCMEPHHVRKVLELMPSHQWTAVECWDIPDDYDYCDPTLVAIIERRLTQSAGVKP